MVCALQHIFLGLQNKKKNTWAEHVASMGGEEGCMHGLWWGNLRERELLENLGVDKILMKQVGCGLD
jgi:hypothetical protein